MPKSKQPTQKQLMAVIQTQTAIAKLGLDLNAVMTLVAEQAQLMTQAKGAVVELAEEGEMVYRAVSGGAAHLLGLRLSQENSLSGLCVIQNKILYCEDSELDARVDKVACRKVGLRSMAVVPLIHCGDAIGVLKIYAEKVSAFKEGDLQLLTLMSELIAAAMYHATRFGAQELYKLATQDQLTGLANRALFLDCLRQGLLTAKQNNKKLGVLMIDMDGLKHINDEYGHRLGDIALKEIADRIKKSIRHDDLVARLGGDEFAVILSSVENQALAKTAMNRISEACGLPFVFENIDLKIGASLGLAIFPKDAQSIDQLIECADLNMYEDKRERKSVKMINHE
ncbi:MULTISPECIES: sensor domain-containing diguanylate cyclase [Acinetobacter]|uniref:sensor domain-containing diguanylate cyclase n=1 Tax=Acinetobacter TaxID=469 RepID=UPI00101FF34B|nr:MULTISPECIES: sensor domain-containing diguanylate cyclase [Acinetobacter]MDM1756587.1 GGDEF domain-containing protein [Acinetobacter sp. 256-1]MDM1759687.1 GGDEF domain-containing protein [Acinetobacter sp. 251-1]RYL28319.1 GGDEF domain-containing protein [Acinetobacter piscicola]